MVRYIVLLNFTEKGVMDVKDSVSRSADFASTAASKGAKVESVFWTVGQYDGVMILSAPDEATAAGLILGLGMKDAVHTCMLRAFEESEFSNVISKIS